jgi:hypothetical protein
MTAIHNGRALSVAIDVSRGNTAKRTMTIAPLAIEVHAQLADFQAGEPIRIVNLYERQDGQLAPTPATVCFRDADCPVFTGPAMDRNEAAGL